MQTMSAKYRNPVATLTTALALALAACGGSDTLQSDEGAARFDYTYFFREGRLLALVTFEGGLVYGFYQSDFSAPTYPEYVYAGFFTARLDTLRDEALLRVGTEYRFEERNAVPIELRLAAPSGDTVFGILTQVNTGEESPFSVRESTNSRLPTDPTTLPGAYAVQARSPSSSFKATGTVDADGRLSVATGNCSLEAVLSPRQLGNLYDAVATVGSGCQIGEGRYTGHALQAYGLPNFYVFLTAPGRGGIMLLLYQP
jgi:hypothetical protein